MSASVPDKAARDELTLVPPPAPAVTVEFVSSPKTPPPIEDRETLVAPPETPVHEAVTLDPGDISRDPTLQPVRMSGNGRGGTVVGRTFGDYELLNEIAKGGMGVVYKARQRKLNRLVAIKMILAGQFADREDVERFYAEAEAAARMRHENVVGIHEVGEIEGRHFFSMDFIEGPSLAGIIRENPLPPREAARIVKAIAEAIQHAHDHGILHRDLKPANVLMENGKPIVTDFGLAKRVEGGSQLTVSGAIVGTPSYMPPEQAEGMLHEICPQSDVYSLGAILYEVLTGSPPFRGATPYETIRQVIENDPIAPRLHNPAIPVDLETIALKCLEKVIGKRYPTAKQVAEELGRYLDGQPILARRIGRTERAWRWCRRNPWIASLSALLVLAVLGALLGTSVGMVLARRAEGRANVALRHAMRSIDRMFTFVSENRLLKMPGAQTLRKELLQDARGLYEELLEEQGENPAILDELALSYFRLGRILEELGEFDQARDVYTRAQTMQERLLRESPTPAHRAALGDTLNAFGGFCQNRGELDAAREYFTGAIRHREQLAQTSENGDALRKLANGHMNLGQLEWWQGRNAEAKEQLLKAVELRKQLRSRGLNDAKLERDNGKGAFILGKLALSDRDDSAAIPHFAEAVAAFEKLVRDNPPDMNPFDNRNFLANSCRSLADSLVVAKRWDEAAEMYDKSIAELRRLAQENPDRPDFCGLLASALTSRGELNLCRDKPLPELTAADCREALMLLEPLLERASLETRKEWAIATRGLGTAEISLGQHDAGVQHLRLALEELQNQLQELRDQLQGLEQASDAVKRPLQYQCEILEDAIRVAQKRLSDAGVDPDSPP